uniref:Innexin n=1 Tax=Caenorhabditis tropicalis TaxID=1561998 RepID=A0A1I7V1A3_9PELO
MSIIYADLHAITYAGLQCWSLYRSLVYSTDPENIVFTGVECYPVTWAVGFCKMLMIFIQFALTVER